MTKNELHAFFAVTSDTPGTDRNLSAIALQLQPQSGRRGFFFGSGVIQCISQQHARPVAIPAIHQVQEQQLRETAVSRQPDQIEKMSIGVDEDAVMQNGYR
jgi:hypothetical protein